jgi:hypothetical protein
MHWFPSFLLIAVAGFSAQLTHTELVAADPMLHKPSQRVRTDGRAMRRSADPREFLHRPGLLQKHVVCNRNIKFL